MNTIEGAGTFHFFKYFPFDIRLEVWVQAASVPRVIELDKVSDGPQSAGNGQALNYVRVAPNSRVPPAILHVNSESRIESFKYYQLTNFENKPRKWGFSSEHYIYYNPLVDIVYFGENSSLSTLITVLRKGLSIPNVAIVHSTSWVDRSLLPLGGLALLQILHGIEREVFRNIPWFQVLPGNGNKRWPGCDGLKTLLLVLPSRDEAAPKGGNARSVHFQTLNDAALAEHDSRED